MRNMFFFFCFFSFSIKESCFRQKRTRECYYLELFRRLLLKQREIGHAKYVFFSSVFFSFSIKESFFLYLLHPSGRVSKSTVFTNHNLISVRHRKYRLIILLYLHVISCSSTWNFASSRDPEPRPSLESSNHSGFDLMAASIVESDLVFG